MKNNSLEPVKTVKSVCHQETVNNKILGYIHIFLCCNEKQTRSLHRKMYKILIVNITGFRYNMYTKEQSSIKKYMCICKNSSLETWQDLDNNE